MPSTCSSSLTRRSSVEADPFSQFWYRYLSFCLAHVPESTARPYFKCLLSAVDYLHSHGVSHNDIKPGKSSFSNLSLTKKRIRGTKYHIFINAQQISFYHLAMNLFSSISDSQINGFSHRSMPSMHFKLIYLGVHRSTYHLRELLRVCMMRD